MRGCAYNNDWLYSILFHLLTNGSSPTFIGWFFQVNVSVGPTAFGDIDPGFASFVFISRHYGDQYNGDPGMKIIYKIRTQNKLPVCCLE